MKIDKQNPRHYWALLVQGILALLAAASRPFTSKPKKPVILLYGHQLSGNLRALYEEWEKSHQQEMSMHFLSLDPDYSHELRGRGIQVLACNSLKDMLVLRWCHTIITDHGLHALEPLLYLTNIRFIDVWHGIPFKGFIPEDFKLQHKYDEVWVSSQLLKKLYLEKFGFDEDKVIPLGYARTDKLFRRDKPRDDLHQILGIPMGNKIVLYAPTWQQDNKGRELFPFGETQQNFTNGIAQVCSNHNATLVIRSHLNASISNLPRDNIVYCSMKDYTDAEELLLHTDVLLCDWSSIAFDYLALERPTIFLDVTPPFKNGFSLGPEYRFGAVVADMKALQQELTSILADPGAYQARYAAKQRDVRQMAYGELQKGNAAATQLERLQQPPSKQDIPD